MRAQTVVRITGTKNTAHLEQPGAANQPVCVIHRNHFNPEDEAIITPNRDPNIEARTSSIALPNIEHNHAVRDVKDKLKTIYTQLSATSQYKGPMIYNALMSFSGKKKERLFNFFGIDKNKQRARLVRVLKGSHLFNKQQIDAGNLDQLCYVQAIPVNQHELKISYDTSDAGRREALLMSEIAMLSTLNHYAAHLPYQLRYEVQTKYQSLHRLYTDFLVKNEVGDAYFCESYQGKAAIKELIRFKNYGKTVNALGTDDRNDSLEALVAKALLKMMLTRCYDDAPSHQKKQFGTLTQTLSVFLEPMSIYGCKSANELFAMVSGRVDLLKSIANKPADALSPEEKVIITELKAFVNDERWGEKRPSEKLQTALDKAYNLYNLEGAATAVSKRDQGGPLKVKASKNRDNLGKVKQTEFNGNIAETAHLTYLPKQKGAAPLQAHKKDSNGKDQAQQFVAVVEEKFGTQADEQLINLPAAFH